MNIETLEPAAYILIPLRRRDGTIRAHAIIDAEDKHLAVHRWCMDGRYAVRALPQVDGVRRLIYLHRAVLGLTLGDGVQCDHIDRDKLNCRRSNLRIVTNAQNRQNQPSRAGSSSRYRGVTWSKKSKKWRADAKLNGVLHHLGYFDDEQEAARVASEFRAQHMPFSSDALERVA